MIKTPQVFLAKWQRVTLSEKSACQQHFLDLCELQGQPKPAEAHPEGAWYTFERGVRKQEGGQGWVDVWKTRCSRSCWRGIWNPVSRRLIKPGEAGGRTSNDRAIDELLICANAHKSNSRQRAPGLKSRGLTGLIDPV